MSSPIDILLVSGTHANEACAPLIARGVFRMLSGHGARVAHCAGPNRYTLLAWIDHPEIAVTNYSIPAGERRLDVDLDTLDEPLGRLHPEALVLEFYNSEDTHPMLGIDPAKPVEEYEVGPIGPGASRTYEIATWRNVDSLGRPGKCLIEVPACYAPVGLAVRDRRRTAPRPAERGGV